MYALARCETDQGDRYKHLVGAIGQTCSGHNHNNQENGRGKLPVRSDAEAGLPSELCDSLGAWEPKHHTNYQ